MSEMTNTISAEQIAIMQVALEYHLVLDPDISTERLLQILADEGDVDCSDVAELFEKGLL